MELDEIRKKIDQIDDKLTKLLIERMETTLEIGKYKKKNGLNVLDQSREKAVLEKVTKQTGEEYRDYITSVFKVVMKHSKKQQNKLFSISEEKNSKCTD